MRARRSVWSDPEVQRLLRSFVPAADEVGRLQRDKDPECAAFQGFCEQGHYGGRTQPTSTRQGTYAVTPSGRFLASINTNDPVRMAAMLQRALDAWQQIPAAERQLPAEQRQSLEAMQRFEDRRPSGGLVLAEYMRDLRAPQDPDDWRQRAWNEDQAWFLRDEARAFVPADIAAGASCDVPSVLVHRLARLHLVDSVRGQTPAFPKPAVLEATLRSEVVGVDGARVRLRFAGATRTEAKGRWPRANGSEPEEQVRGIATRLTGRATWDREAGQFVAFELVAIGERHGATQYNERGNDPGPAAIGFAFVLAGEGHPRVAPAFWWDYDWR